MKYLTLNNNTQIPILGSGTNTFGKADHDFYGLITYETSEIENAIQIGYRLFDTAIMYRNEEVLGIALEKSGLPRKEFYITSKIPGKSPYIDNSEEVNKAINNSLKYLKTDYLDLYLIHHPWEDEAEMVKVWKTLETAVADGRIKSLGVSNFNQQQLTYLLENSKIKPVVNQIESHPGLWQDELISFCKKENIAVQAWKPVGKVSEDAKDILTTIGNKYHKTWAQIILRYQVERDIIVIPKSTALSRQQENFDIFDFSLSPEDKEIISKL